MTLRQDTATDSTRRIAVFEDEVTTGAGQGARADEIFAQLASLTDPQTQCFIGAGSGAVRALEAAHEAKSPVVRIILDQPRDIAREQLTWMTSSEAIQVSDTLILCHNTSPDASQACARLLKSLLPRATLLFLYSAAAAHSGRQSDSYWTAIRDFLRWGPGFIIKR